MAPISRLVSRPAPMQRALAVVLIPILLIALVLSSGPGLHQLLHADASLPTHECVISSFASGQVIGAEMGWVIVIFASMQVGFRLRELPVRVVRRDFRLGVSRAPPH